MTAAFATTALVLMASLLFAAGCVVLAIGARTWSDATASAHRARAHGNEADATERTILAAQEALDEAKERPRAAHVPPSDEDLERAILAERAANNGKTNEPYFTTESNEGIPEQPPIIPGSFYNTANLEETEHG